ncbi:MAG: biotin transporter BioY [Treponema sp.]
MEENGEKKIERKAAAGKKHRGMGVILAALFAALTAAGCFIQIPLPGGIPIVLQDMMAMLSGMLLGPLYGTVAVFVFLVLGCIGLPVFSGKAGLHVIIGGPTGGFLVGYLLAALAAGIVIKLMLPPSKKHGRAISYIAISAAGLTATVIVFICGIIGFRIVTHCGLAKALAAVLIPFIPGNIIKLVLMVLLTKKFRPVIAEYIG